MRLCALMRCGVCLNGCLRVHSCLFGRLDTLVYVRLRAHTIACLCGCLHVCVCVRVRTSGCVRARLCASRCVAPAMCILVSERVAKKELREPFYNKPR